MEAQTTCDDRRPAAAMTRTSRTLFQLSFPLFLHSLLTFAVVLIDTMIISSHSANAAAAVAVARQVLQIAFEISSLIGVGAVILISHALGRGEEENARQIAATALFANTVFGIAIGLAIAVCGPLILWLLDTPDAIAGDARLYLYAAAASMTLNGFVATGLPCLRAFGQSRTILGIGVVGAIFYLAVEYVLILGIGRLPPLGVLGAGLGAALLRIAMAIMLVVVLRRQPGLRLDLKAAVERLPLVRRMIGLSLPGVSDYIAYGFYQLVLLRLITGFGVVGVLSRTYVMIAMAFLILVVMAVSQGNEVLLGYRRGEGRLDQAFTQALRSCLIASATATAIATLLWLQSDRFIGLFTQDAEVALLSRRLLLLTIFIQPGFAFNTILFQSLRAVGDVRWPVIASQSITWGLGLPLGWTFCVHFGLGVEGVWYALVVEETVKAAFMINRWSTRRRLCHGSL